MEFIDDYIVAEDEMEWIGIFIKVKRTYIVILNENVHDWLIPFYGIFIGFRKLIGMSK